MKFRFRLYSCLLIILLIIGLQEKGTASHIMGGELVYTYAGFNTLTGKHKYNVCLRMYRDDRGINLPASVTIDVRNNNGTYSAAGTFTINKSNATTFVTPPGLAACGLSLGFGVEYGEYCAIIELPSSLLGYHLAYSSCCRNSDIINVSPDGMSYYTFIPPTYLENSSPDFTDLAIPYLCVGDTTTILNTAFDVDGDLLVFSLTNPYDDYSGFTLPFDTLPYTPGYSVLKPFGVNGYANINASTGLTTYMAPDSGLFVLAVEIKEYRNNQLISVVRRDLQFIVINCPVNPPPVLSTTGGSGQTIYNIEEGDSICFPIIFTNIDADSLTFSYNGYIFDSTFNNPPASMSSGNKGDSIVTSQFCWATSCGQANPIPYLFTVNATDNGCPPKTSYVVYTINVAEFQGAPDSVIGPSTVCASETALYSVEASFGSIINWDVIGGTIILGAGTDSVTITWNDTTTGIIKVIESSACSPDTAIKNVKILQTPVANAGNDTSLCLGNSIVIGTSGDTAFTYSWNATNSINDTSLATPIASPVITSTYILRVSAGICGSDTDTVSVVVNSLTIVASNDTNICSGNSTTISVTQNPSTTYLWSPGKWLNDSLVATPIATPIDTTTFKVTVKDTLTGCTKTDSIKIFIDSLPPANAGFDITICQGDTIQMSASGGTFYLWSPFTGLSDTGISNPLAYPADTIAYTVTVTDSSTGCKTNDTVIVNVITDSLKADAGANKSICIGDSIQLNATGGLLYSWFPSTGLSQTNIPNPVAKPSTSITYYVIVSSGSCVSATDSVKITVVLPPNASAGNDTNLCEGSKAFIGMSGIVSNNYKWLPTLGLSDSTASKPLASPTITTIYFLTVTDTIGCINWDTVNVTVNPKPTLNAGPDLGICFGDSIKLAISSDSINTHLWTPNTGLSNANIQKPKASPAITTTYIITVTDGNSCTSTDTLAVTVKSDSLTAVAGNDVSICLKDSFQLNATGGTIFVWTPSTGLSDSGIANPIANPITTTTYVVTVASGLCVTDDDTITIKVNSLPVANAINDTIICRSDSIKIGTTGTADNLYLWNPTTGLNDSTTANPTATPYDTTAYLLVVTDTNGCNSRDSLTINVSYPPSDAGKDTSFCKGGSVTIGSSNNPLYTYLWKPTTGLNNPVISNPIASPSGSTTYELTVSETSSGCLNKDTIVVTINQLPPANAGPDISLCSGDSVSLAASGGDVYAWSPSIGLNDSGISNPKASPVSTTNYILTVSNSITNCVNFDNLTITVNPLPVADAGNDISICKGNSTVLNATGGTTFLWSPTTALSDSNVSQPTATPVSTTKYYVTVMDINSCESVDSITVSVTGPFVNLANDTTICLTQKVSLDASGDASIVSFLWTPGTELSSTTIANPVASPFDTVTYMVTVTDSKGCQNKDSITVNVAPLVPPDISSSFDSKTICTGDSVELKAIGTGITGYAWTDATNPAVIFSTNQKVYVNPNSNTVYIITATNGYCYNSDTVTILLDSVIVEASGDATICIGSSANINANGASFYTWHPGTGLNDTSISNPFATPLSTTSYVVTGTNFNGCEDTDTVLININPTPVIDAGNDTTIMKEESVYLNATVANAVSYVWTPVDGLNNPTTSTPIATPLITTTYYVNVTDNNGCVSMDSLTIEVEEVSLPIVPTAFSPNNDGVNDIVYIRDIVGGDGGGIAELNFKIFSRWGELVFETNSITSGWNGTNNGKELDIGVYTWILNTVSLNGKRSIKSGNVSMIR